MFQTIESTSTSRTLAAHIQAAVFCFVAVLFGTACAAEGGEEPGMRAEALTVTATGDLALDDPRLVEGVRRWNEALGFEVLVLTTDPQADIRVGIGKSCDPGPKNIGLTVNFGTHQSVCLVRYAPEPVLTHELGHALSLPHDLTPNSVMHPTASSEKGTITAQAIAQVRAFVGLD